MIEPTNPNQSAVPVCRRMNGFSTIKTTLLLDFIYLFCSQFIRGKLLVHGSKAKQSKAKDDLSPDVFNAETLNNYLAFRHNFGLPSREPNWARCPAHCLGVCILAHRQASVQVLGLCGDVIQHSCSPRKCPSEEESQQPRVSVRPFRSIKLLL